ncbi:hypothetical protein [Cellulomonas sp. Marseille-Q8402]
MSARSARGAAVDGGEEQLRLTSVLSGGLPATLGTPDAPTLYTVPAVFSRQVSGAERLAIQAPESVRRLADAGYPRVTLDVADRRLLIGSTNLDQLRGGLAHELAELLRDIDRTLADQRERREAEALVARSTEADRAADVQDLVDEIRFA